MDAQPWFMKFDLPHYGHKSAAKSPSVFLRCVGCILLGNHQAEWVSTSGPSTEDDILHERGRKEEERARGRLGAFFLQQPTLVAPVSSGGMKPICFYLN